MDMGRIIGESIYGIVTGYLLGSVLGTALAAACFKEKFLQTLLKPIELVFGILPEIAVVLAFLLRKSDSISFIICIVAMTGFMYSKVIKALKGTDEKLSEMALIFRIPADRQLSYIYLPQIKGKCLTALAIGIVRCLIAGMAGAIICNIL